MTADEIKSDLDDKELESLSETAPDTDADLTTEDSAPFAPDEGSSNWEVDGPGRDWRRIISYAAIAIVVLVLALLLGRWIHHRSLHQGTPAAATTKQAPSEIPQNSPSATKQNTSSGSTATTNSATKPSTPSSSLPNTGPGDVLAIFSGASAGAAGLHYVVRRRQSR